MWLDAQFKSAKKEKKKSLCEMFIFLLIWHMRFAFKHLNLHDGLNV